MPGTQRKKRYRWRVTPPSVRPTSRSRGPERRCESWFERSASRASFGETATPRGSAKPWTESGWERAPWETAGCGLRPRRPMGPCDRGARELVCRELLKTLIGDLAFNRNSKIASQTLLLCRVFPQRCPQNLWISTQNMRKSSAKSGRLSCRHVGAARLWFSCRWARYWVFVGLNIMFDYCV